MKVIAIIQARLSSQRLPRKVLRDIRGHCLLSLLVARLKKVDGLGSIWLATGPREMNADIEMILPAGVSIFYGSEDDVLSRFVSVIDIEACEYVFRVNGDNPFPDFTRMARFIDIAASKYYDYLTVEGMPVGLSTELVRAECLRTLLATADKRQREHITLALRENETHYRVLKERVRWESVESVRFTIDEERDLRMLEALLTRHPGAIDMEVGQLIRLLVSSPDLSGINRDVAQKKV